MKNLVILHLESISRQRLAAFAAVLPHTTRLLSEALAFDNFFASATSTRMVVGYLFHGNDFEYDTATTFEGMQAEVNNPHLFSILRDHGYNAHLICLNGFQRHCQVATDSDAMAGWILQARPTVDTVFHPKSLATASGCIFASPSAIATSRN